jgi:hypothetical protein
MRSWFEDSNYWMFSLWQKEQFILLSLLASVVGFHKYGSVGYPDMYASVQLLLSPLVVVTDAGLVWLIELGNNYSHHEKANQVHGFSVSPNSSHSYCIFQQPKLKSSARIATLQCPQRCDQINQSHCLILRRGFQSLTKA